MENQVTKEIYTKDMSEIKAKLDECVTRKVYEKEMTEVKTTLQEHSEEMA